MAYVSKVWVDRQTEYPTRRKLEFDDGTDDKIVTVSRAEGTIYEAGDIFDANTMNTLESRIAAGIAEKQDILIAGNGIRIDQDNVISATGGGGGIEFTKIESGSLVSVNDAADLPVVDLAVEIKAVQSGTGDPSPSNVRPISGYTGLNLTRAEKNLYGGNKLATDMDSVFESGYSRTGNVAEFDASATVNESFGYLPYSENTSYTIIMSVAKSNTNKSTNLRVYYTDGTNTNIQIPETSITADTKYTFAFVTNGSKTLKSIRKYTGSGKTTLYIDEFGIFEGTLTASQFEPYSATTYPVTWQTEAGTVYGGSLDVTSGVLTITHGKVTLNGQQSIRTVNWQPKTNSVGWLYSYSVTENLLGIPRTDIPDMKCDSLKPINYNSLTQNDGEGIGLYDTNYCGLVVRMADTSLTTESAINTYLASNPIDVVFPLAQPVTVQLTPTEIETILGINNIWADSGDILNLEYYTQSASDVRDFIIKDEETTTNASWSSDKIQDELDAKQDSLTAGDGIVISQNNEISAVLYTELTATLNVFSTSVVFEDASITTNSVIDIYTSKYGFNPETVTAETGRLTITFRQPDEQITVKVRIS